MFSRRTLLTSASVLATLALTLPTTAWAKEPIPVVATFSILGDMVERIGGEHIVVTTLVGPDGDAHVYQPTPQAARAVAEADLMFVNGLDFEGWLERLAQAAAFDGALVVATDGIEALTFDEHGDEHGDHEDHDDHDDDHDDHEDDHDDHDKHEGEHDDHDDHAGHDHGAFDPHAWQSLTHAVTYVDNITAGLAKADPENAADYYANRATYVTEIEALNVDVTAMMAGLPEEKRTVVTSHDAFGYFAHAYGFNFEAPQGLSTESEVSAADVAELIEQIREEGISAVFIEAIADNRLLKQIANETDATIGGTLYSDGLSNAEGPASTYLDMMRHNAETLSKALSN
ncbi:MAG: zinc ABC transporter substrate-binding protein [Planktotalea sp.]|uniref:metal ABC transporter solute-binding protein, Zn/Mn family n=1 Tax=Planktotalea sp. TaxID=2029877 RepID=UPI00262D5B21|nr:zinc ABC transporter substrate-binding protein [Planktotalea sp.]MDG1085757.1 zinc ABC transporter substrate-binding protein [Planktotalea sp.]